VRTLEKVGSARSSNKAKRVESDLAAISADPHSVSSSYRSPRDATAFSSSGREQSLGGVRAWTSSRHEPRQRGEGQRASSATSSFEVEVEALVNGFLVCVGVGGGRGQGRDDATELREGRRAGFRGKGDTEVFSVKPTMMQ
jgi:hypothetical protein